MRLDGKITLVTGAGSGIGKCIAETYAREGARVALADINTDAAKSAARAIGNRAIALRCDVSKKADVDGVVEETLAAFGALNILVSNAGATHVNKPVLDISEAEYDRIFAVNVKGIFLACQAVVSAFRKQGGGVIINIGSTAGLRRRPGLSAFNATKGAVHVLTKSLAVELAPDGIRVCAIAPVATDAVLSRLGTGHAREVYCHDPHGPSRYAAGHRRCGFVPGFGRGQIRHRQYHGGRWRPRCLGSSFDPRHSCLAGLGVLSSAQTVWTACGVVNQKAPWRQMRNRLRS